MNEKMIIIGGGAAGLMASISASSRGNKVVVLEKGDKPARKLRITGKGRCNITNFCDVQDTIANIPGNGTFLHSSLNSFTNYDIISFFEECGVKTKVERGERVFPVSDSAKDIVDALINKCNNNGVVIKKNSKVKRIIVDKSRVAGVEMINGREHLCKVVILATGGKSYPKTGSNGDGYKIASELGHTIIHPKPSLVPLVSNTGYVPSLQGLSLKNVAVQFVYDNKSILYEGFGEMLFTHFGVSGPLVLSASRHLLEYNYKDIDMIIDLKPALSFEQLEKRIQRDLDAYSRKMFCNSLNDLLPQRLIPIVIENIGIDPYKPSNQLTKKERTRLTTELKSLRIKITGSRSVSEAIVTAGGISTDEINPSTMESKIIKGLYFAGEVIDVDAYTGGYNLSIAFSTGHLAGQTRGK